MTKERIISLLAAAITVAAVSSSCIKNEIDRDPLTEDVPIDFTWYTLRAGIPATKADADYYISSGSTHLQSEKSFGVFGYFHPQYEEGGTTKAGGWQDGKNDNTPNLFYNEGVSISEDGGYYTYDYENSRFWPRNEYDRISFFAYYPYNPGIADGVPAAGTIVESFLDKTYEREGLVGFYYTVPDAAENQVDFMVSDLCLDQSKAVWTSDHSKGLTGTTNGKVKFFFHHALSQVRIKSVNFDKSGNDDVDVKINYIMFNNVAVFGQCIPVPDFASKDADTGRVPITPTWPVGGLSASRPSLTSGVKADVCYSDPSDESSLITENILLMIPHTFFTGATIEVNFDVKRAKGATGEFYEYKNNTLSAPLTTYTVTGWEAGKIYNYVITLNLKKINIEADVIDWVVAGDDVIMEQ